MTASLYNYLVVAAVLFALGSVGFLARRNLIVMLLSAEMMLQGVALTLVSLGGYRRDLDGQVFSIFIITVAACEAGLALALIVVLYQHRRTLNAGLWTELGESEELGAEPMDGAGTDEGSVAGSAERTMELVGTGRTDEQGMT